MTEGDFGVTKTFSECFESAIEIYKNSSEDSLPIPGAKGFFITRDAEKGRKVMYIAGKNVDGVEYYAYHMNPVFKEE